MRVLLVTDAWSPQVNGVVTTLVATVRELRALGHVVDVISPDRFRTLPCPTYPDIRLAIGAGRAVARMIDAFAPDAIHVATEGPLGLAARAHCVRSGYAFTTAFHTQFPEYVHARCRLPLAAGYRALRWFHGAAAAVMVATPSVGERLAAHGITHTVHWSRGVDASLFRPALREDIARRPVFLYTGRLAVEKNVAAFLALDLPGTRWVVGDGPARRALEARFPDAVFHGAHAGAALARFYQQADAFVFPSRTDTFGLVLIEAMACGTPVAAYPVQGPRDVVRDPAAGVLDEDLQRAALHAIGLDRGAVARYGATYTWPAATRQFIGNLHPATPASALQVA
ncbi:MAG: glycosyltransferase family 1 protein [Proteobacteria bacterium]|nr:glycosyltransferase family 1 protein [Pseudomonadota bacterium]